MLMAKAPSVASCDVAQVPQTSKQLNVSHSVIFSAEITPVLCSVKH